MANKYHHHPTTKRWLSTTLDVVVIFYFGLLAASCFVVVAVDAAPLVVLTTHEPFTQTVAEDILSSGVPYEFPEDYSISLEEAVATRKEFASAAILKMVTDIMAEIAQGKKVRQEMMEAIVDLQGRLKGQQVDQVAKMIQIPVDSTSQQVDSRRPESKERRPKSCQDLQHAGHSLSGFYLVRGKAHQGLEIVFCPFNNDTHQDDNSLVVEESVEIVAAA